MRVAIVHDFLTVYAGAERVLEQLIALFPDADLYALFDFVPDEDRAFLRDKRVATTFIQRLPLARRRYRSYAVLMPLAIEQLDLARYDLIISSSYAVAKGVLIGPDQLHISYVHSPMRYAWDLQHQYLREGRLERGLRSLIARWMLHRLRIWDCRTANGVDCFVANSRFIARRIRKIYRRDSQVIYPPVDTGQFSLHRSKEDFYVTASRMVPYKRIPLIVEAFAEMPERKLVVVGDGPDLPAVRKKATRNVSVLGQQPFAVLRDLLQRSRAFVFAAEEDFGIVPLEAQACGTPVIAFGKGGVRETIKGLDHEEPTGVFFQEQSAEAIVAAVSQLESQYDRFAPEICRTNAERFSPDRFRAEFRSLVEQEWERFERARRQPEEEGSRGSRASDPAVRRAQSIDAAQER